MATQVCAGARDHPGQDDGSRGQPSVRLTPAEIESWVEDGKRGMANALRAKPEDVREQYERQLKDLQEAYGEAIPRWVRWPGAAAGARRQAAPTHGQVRLTVETIDLLVVYVRELRIQQVMQPAIAEPPPDLGQLDDPRRQRLGGGRGHR